ncbi:hypothetical protein ACFLRW_04320 [Acidobacteriota bacterium]
MQKKIQIVLPIWLGDYLEMISDQYDLSISELTRLQICYAIIAHTDNLYPEYNPEIPTKKISKSVFKFLESDDREDFLRFISDVYFEARKAAKFRSKKTKEKKPD